MTRPQQKTERNFSVVIASEQKINEPWLEKQALIIEHALIHDCSEDILGAAVAANFEENGFEVDFTVEANSLSEAYDKLGRAMSIVEKVAGISLEGEADEIRSDWVSNQPLHDTEVIPA